VVASREYSCCGWLLACLGETAHVSSTQHLVDVKLARKELNMWNPSVVGTTVGPNELFRSKNKDDKLMLRRKCRREVVSLLLPQADVMHDTNVATRALHSRIYSFSNLILVMVLTLAGTEIQGKTTQQDRRSCRGRRIVLPGRNTWKRVQPSYYRRNK
jgi:hypothetical protein